MSEIAKATQETIGAYLQILIPRLPVMPYEIRIFGSCARGLALAFSDVDLGVISDVFRDMPWAKRLDLLEPKEARLWRIAPVGITFDELRSYRYPSVIRTIRDSEAVTLLKSSGPVQTPIVAGVEVKGGLCLKIISR